MKRSYIAPENFEVTDEQLQWAMTTFRITKEEVLRQTDEWKDFEYKRPYFDWNRAWKRWFRQGDKYGTLKREPNYRRPEDVSEEQLKKDREDWARDMQQRFGRQVN